MSHGGAQELYVTAAAMSTSAAFMIRQPWAFYVPVVIGMLISSPEAISAAGSAWRTIDREGLTRELDDLLEDLVTLREKLKKEGKWEGGAWEVFEQVHESFVTAAKALKDLRNDCGDAMQQAAKVYYIGASVAMSVATGMLALGVYKTMFSVTPVTAAAAEVTAAARGAVTMKTLRKVLLKHGLVVGALATALTTIVQLSEQTGALFPGMEGIPAEMSTLKSGGGMTGFENAGLQYDKETGMLTQAMDGSVMENLPGRVGKA